MLDGPKVAGIVLIVLFAILALGLYLYERRHGGHGRHRDREPQRLPLFGTEQLAIRSLDGHDEYQGDAPARPVIRARPTEPATPAGHHAVGAGGNGRTPTPARQFAPPSAPVRRPETPRESFRPMPLPAASAAPSQPTIEHASIRPAMPRSPMSGPPGLADLGMIDGETLRFTIPTDGTVEFIPGRLEIVAGPESGREIRFVRTSGETDVEVTFGRSEGPPNRHVQILARTVSRRHAVMSLIDEHWQLTNLSSTNPVVFNGRVLAGNEVAPLLVEGDRIEMGEVAFVFHDG